MNTNVLPMRPMTLDPADAEKIRALYIALSVNPEIRFAPSITRAQYVYKVLAGMRAAAQGFNPRDEVDERGFAQAVALLASDKKTASDQGWKW